MPALKVWTLYPDKWYYNTENMCLMPDLSPSPTYVHGWSPTHLTPMVPVPWLHWPKISVYLKTTITKRLKFSQQPVSRVAMYECNVNLNKQQFHYYTLSGCSQVLVSFKPSNF